MGKKNPNYTARRTGAMGVLGGVSGAAGAAINPAARLAAAGLDSGASAVAHHIVNTGLLGATTAAGGYLAYKGIKAGVGAIKRHAALRNDQFDK